MLCCAVLGMLLYTIKMTRPARLFARPVQCHRLAHVDPCLGLAAFFGPSVCIVSLVDVTRTLVSFHVRGECGFHLIPAIAHNKNIIIVVWNAAHGHLATYTLQGKQLQKVQRESFFFPRIHVSGKYLMSDGGHVCIVQPDGNLMQVCLLRRAIDRAFGHGVDAGKVWVSEFRRYVSGVICGKVVSVVNLCDLTVESFAQMPSSSYLPGYHATEQGMCVASRRTGTLCVLSASGQQSVDLNQRLEFPRKFIDVLGFGCIELCRKSFVWVFDDQPKSLFVSRLRLEWMRTCAA